MSIPDGFIDRPGLAGPFGALMDEYARAAGQFCAILEAVPAGLFTRSVASHDADTVTIQALGAHVVRAARGYASYIREARGLPFLTVAELPVDPATLVTPAAVRPLFAAAMRYTEGALEGFYEADEATIQATKFTVRWGPTYDPEMILEHAVCHLLRHRRQIERWPR